MQLTVNGERKTLTATSLPAALKELGYDPTLVATAVNGSFISRNARDQAPLNQGDLLDIVAPQQGG